MTLTTLSPTKKLALEGKGIGCVNIPAYNLIALSSHNDAGKIRVFKNDSRTNLIHVFELHNPGSLNVKIVHLFDDMVCSLDDVGNLYTWSANSGIVSGLDKLHRCRASTLI